MYNARFIVQSNDRSPGYLDERVESFIAGFREVRDDDDGRLRVKGRRVNFKGWGLVFR